MKMVKPAWLSLSTFLVLTLCILIPIGLMTTASWLSWLEQGRRQYETSKKGQMDYITETLKKEFDLISVTAQQLLYENWVTRYTNHIDLYRDEFDHFKKAEITKAFKDKRQMLPFVTDILMFVPSKNSVTTADGWFKLSDFEEIHENISTEALSKKYTTVNWNDYSAVSTSEKNEMIISYGNQFLADSKCCVSFIIDLTELQKYVNGISLNQFDRVAALLGVKDEPFIPRDLDGLQNSTAYLYEYSAALQFIYPPYDTAIGIREFSSVVFASIALFVLGIALAAFLSYFLNAPVYKLIKTISSVRFNSLKKSCSYLADYLHNMLRQNQELTLTLEQYRSISKNEIVFNMLTNPNFDYEDETVKEIFPWISKGLPYRVILFGQQSHKAEEEISGINPCRSSGSGNDERPGQRIEELIRSHLTPCYIFSVLNSGIGVLTWDSAPSACDGFVNEIKNSFSDKWCFAVSEQYFDMKQLNECYLRTGNELISLLGYYAGEKYQLSISFEIRLIQAIQQNDVEVFDTLIEEIKNVSKPIAAIGSVDELLTRLAAEYGIKLPEVLLADTAGRLREDELPWIRTVKLCTLLGEAISKKKSSTVSDTASLIKSYIDANYGNCDVSLKLLSDVFSLEPSFISKLYKMQFGVNFIDYLLELRTAKAKELLNTSKNMSLSAIAHQVGYLNYSSFKRAFIRMYGISPKQFREQ